MAYNKRPTINDRPATINSRPATINARPSTINRRPAPPAGGNTSDVVGVGATVADVIATNSVGDVAEVGV